MKLNFKTFQRFQKKISGSRRLFLWFSSTLSLGIRV